MLAPKSMERVINVLYDEGRESDASDDMKAYLKRLLDLDWDDTVWDGSVTVPGLNQNKDLLTGLRKYISSERISLDPAQRMKHAIGSSSLEMVRARAGKLPEPVDAVISPLDNEAEELIASYPNVNVRFTIYGGGSSVTGGVKQKGTGDTVCIDTSNLKDFRLDDNIMVAGSGLTGREIELKLNEQGRTLGFFPESIQYSTVGGWIATRATGQESNQYGDIEDILLGVRLARSDGVVKDQENPRYSTGLMAKDIALGSEGMNGLVLSATFETFPFPRNRFFSTHMFQSFSEAIEHVSKLRMFPSVLRISDETETELALLDVDRRTRNFLKRYLSVRGIINGSMAIVMSNDKSFGRYLPESVWVGGSGGRKWFKTRFERPWLANALWKRGVTVDTLETSCKWAAVEKLHSSVSAEFYRTVRDAGSSGVIMAHLSHQYHAGTCIYFTFLIKAEHDEETLLEVRQNIEETILAESGSITHHHGIGTYFEKYLDEPVKKLQKSMHDSMFVTAPEGNEEK